VGHSQWAQKSASGLVHMPAGLGSRNPYCVLLCSKTIWSFLASIHPLHFRGGCSYRNCRYRRGAGAAYQKL